MKPRKAQSVASSLKRKGFRPQERDHTFYRFFAYGRRTPILTKISHGASECSRSLLSQMAKQLHLSSDEFARMLNCPMKSEEYVRLLCERGILDPEEILQTAIHEVASTQEEDH